MTIRRSCIYVATLDPVVGKEIAKTRPVLVLSNEMNNKHSGTVTVLPITSKKLHKIFPFEVFLPKGTGNLPKNSKVKADQIRPLDKRRLVSYVRKIDALELRRVEKAVKIHLDLL